MAAVYTWERKALACCYKYNEIKGKGKGNRIIPEKRRITVRAHDPYQAYGCLDSACKALSITLNALNGTAYSLPLSVYTIGQ
jgi:hypothetical protein